MSWRISDQNKLKDPYVQKENLIEVFWSLEGNVTSDIDELFEKVSNNFNDISNRYIYKILLSIKITSFKYKINLIEKIKKHFKNKVYTKLKAESHKEQSLVIQAQQKKINKEERTKIYKSSDQHIKKFSYKKTYELFDPDVYIIKVSEEDLSDIYLLLENENAWWYEKFNSTDQDQKEQEQINMNPFIINSIMIQRN